MRTREFLLATCVIALSSVPSAYGQARTARDLLEEAKQSLQASSFAAAESLAVAARAQLEAETEPSPTELASAHLMIAQSLYSRRLYRDGRALESATRALALFESSTPDGDARRGDAHHILAEILKELNRSPEAVPHAERALAIRRSALGDDHEQVASSLYCLAVAQRRVGRIGDALATFRECLALRLRLNLPKDKWIGHTHGEIADLLELQGLFDEARAEHEAALAEYDARLDPGDAAIAQGLQKFASFESHSGNIARSIDLGQRAADIAAASPKYNPANLALLRANAGVSYGDIGDFRRGRVLMEQSLPVLQQNLGPKHRSTLWLMSALAFMQTELGDSTEAIRRAQEVRQIIEADSTLGDTTVLSQVLVIEARLTAGFDIDRALQLLERAEAVERARPAPAGHRIAVPLALEIELYAKRGDTEAVAAATQRLDEVLVANQLRGTKFEVIAFGQQGLAQWHLGNLDEGVRLTCDASRLSIDHLIQNVRSLPDRQCLTHASIHSMPMAALLEMATAPRSPHAATVLDELIRWRGLVAAEIGRRRPPRGDAASAAAVVHAEWIAAQRALAQAEVRLATSGRDSAAVARVDSLRTRADTAERAWAGAAAGAQISPERVGLDQVRAALKPDDALVSVALARRNGGQHLIALVLRAAAPSVRILDFGSTTEVSSCLAPWLALCGTSPRGDREREVQCRRAGLEVRKKIWDPIAESVGDAHDIYVVPEGALHTIPWSALPDGDGYLVERDLRVHVLDAERDLLRGSFEDPGAGLLAVGGVDFDGLADEPMAGTPLLIASSRAMFVDCPDTVDVLLPLPGTDEEIRSIENVWAETTGTLEGTSLPAEPVDVLRGSEASEAALKLLAPGHRVLHLATHGIVLGDSCAATTEGTRGVGGLAPVGDERAPSASARSAPPKPAPHESPWLGRRVYLALAGANRAHERERDDNEGFLTAEEVATLDLRGTEWVVLSACQSGVAAAWEREGLLGMRRAFRIAGARSVIASQWPVDDVATLEWMTALYRARTGASSTTAVLQRACREVLEARRAQRRSTHPFYWAAFAASGR